MTSNIGGWQQLVRTTGTGGRKMWLSGMIQCASPRTVLHIQQGVSPPWKKEKQASVGHPHSPLGATRDPGYLVGKNSGRTRFASRTVIQESVQGTDAIFSTFAMTVVGHMPRLPARRASLTPSRDPLGCDSPKRNAQKKKKIKIKN